MTSLSHLFPGGKHVEFVRCIRFIFRVLWRCSHSQSALGGKSSVAICWPILYFDHLGPFLSCGPWASVMAFLIVWFFCTRPLVIFCSFLIHTPFFQACLSICPSHSFSPTCSIEWGGSYGGSRVCKEGARAKQTTGTIIVSSFSIESSFISSF